MITLDLKNNGIKKTDKVVVAVSGGPDSMALLHLLHQSGFKKLLVAHVDHCIRPESYRDVQLVHSTADKMGYEFFLHKVNVPKLALQNSENLEAVGRAVRYTFFDVVKEEHDAKYIATAHHADDQVETVLMNILRGCGLDGLGGMRVLDEDLWRPLLNTSKEDLYHYCREHHVSFVRESTNDDLRYRRNFLRHKVIPQLKKLNPSLLGTMQNNVRMWQQAADELRQRAQEFLQSSREKNYRYALGPFLKLNELEQSVVLRELHDEVHGHKQDLVQDHLEQVLKVLRTNVSGKKKEFGPGKMLKRHREFFEVIDA